MPGFDNNVVFADNVDFTGSSPVAGKVTADGQLLIGSTSSPNIRVGTLTAGPGVSITNGAGAITIGLSGGSQAIDSLSTDLSGPVVPNSSGNVAVTGGTNIYSDGSVANTLRLNLQGNNHELFIGRGTNTSATTLGAATNGQIPIGSTGSDPVLATITAGAGISVTNGAGSITIGLSGGGQAIDSLSTDLSGPVAPDSNGNVAVTGSSTLFSDGSTANTLKLNIQGTNHALFVGRGALTAATTLAAATNGQLPIGSTGADPVLATLTAGTGVSISNGAGSITIAATGGGMTWTEVTGVSQSAAVNNGYIANNAGLVTITLPSTFAVGDVVRIGGKGAGLWALAANTGDTIHFGAQDTSVGGSLTATNRYDTVEVVGITANSDWLVLSSVGNLTVA